MSTTSRSGRALLHQKVAIPSARASHLVSSLLLRLTYHQVELPGVLQKTFILYRDPWCFSLSSVLLFPAASAHRV